MVYGKDCNVSNVPCPSPGLADGLLREEPSQGVPSQGHDNLGPHKFNLAIQVFAARLNLTREWVSIVRRPTLHHVGDINVFALHTDLSKKLLQELASGPNEWPPLLVFPKPRRLSYEHNVRRLRTLSRNSARPSARQLAVLAGVYLGGNVLKLGQ